VTALETIEFCWDHAPDSGMLNTIRKRITGLINSPPVIFPELTRSLEEKVTKLQSSKQIAKSPILDWEGSDMTTSLNLLKPGEQLNDEIINTYLGLLRQKCDPRTVHIASTRLLTSQTPHRVDRCLIDSLAVASTFIIPLHKPGQPGHWRLAILERAESIYSLKIHDTATERSEIPPNLSKWLLNNGIKINKPEIDTTLQQNRFSLDCGLYILLIARIKVTPPTNIIPPSDEVRRYIPKFRLRVLCELLAAHLDPTLSHFTEFDSGEKTCIANNQPERTVPSGKTVPPEKTVPGPSSIQQKFSFNSKHNDLRDLSSILEKACSAGADKVGAIKILLPGDSKSLDNMKLTHATYIFKLSYSGDVVRASCDVKSQRVHAVFKPGQYDQVDPEELVIAFEKGVEKGDFGSVVYVPDILVHKQSLRQKLGLPPSLLMDLTHNALSSSSKKLAGIHTPMGYLSTQKGMTIF
jgi:hypothetical protein